jgi:LysR family transcriptional regulator, glycine cleavage system transcriptional activator
MARRIPLGSLRVFEAAARCASFKLAAAELSVTPGAVSRQVASLEEGLGARLFERRNREVALTEAGRAYYEEIRAAIAKIDAASARIAKPPQRRVVRVDTTPVVALHWMIPRLPQFNARHPGIEVELTTSVGPVKRNREFDWIVRRDPKDFRGLKGEPFVRELTRLVASPRLARALRLKRPADLVRCRLIENKARPDLWQAWFAANGLDGRRYADRIELDQTIYTIQGALEGLGVAVIPDLYIADLLKAGSLAHPMGEQPVVTGACYLITLKPQKSEAAETFREWVKNQA